jgi:hypothetical protein
VRVEIDSEREEIVVGGIKYAYEFLATLSFAPIGTVVEIVRRENGQITLKTISMPRPDAEKVETRR